MVGGGAQEGGGKMGQGRIGNRRTKRPDHSSPDLIQIESG